MLPPLVTQRLAKVCRDTWYPAHGGHLEGSRSLQPRHECRLVRTPTERAIPHGSLCRRRLVRMERPGRLEGWLPSVYLQLPSWLGWIVRSNVGGSFDFG